MGAALLGIWSNQVREEPLPLFQPLPRRSLEYIELDEAYEQFGGKRCMTGVLPPSPTAW